MRGWPPGIRPWIPGECPPRTTGASHEKALPSQSAPGQASQRRPIPVFHTTLNPRNCQRRVELLVDANTHSVWSSSTSSLVFDGSQKTILRKIPLPPSSGTTDRLMVLSKKEDSTLYRLIMLKDTSLDAVWKDEHFDMWPMPKVAAKEKIPSRIREQAFRRET